MANFRVHVLGAAIPDRRGVQPAIGIDIQFRGDLPRSHRVPRSPGGRGFSGLTRHWASFVPGWAASPGVGPPVDALCVTTTQTADVARPAWRLCTDTTPASR